MDYLHSFSKRGILIGVAALVGVGALGYYIYFYSIRPTAPPSLTGTENGSEMSASGPQPVPASPAAAQAAPAPEEKIARLDIPELRRPTIFSSVFSVEAQGIMRRRLEANIAALEKDPRNFFDWMNLAILRKTVDDYEGARQIWEFLKTTNPEQPGPYANLASLYGFELKDSSRAEENFIEAIRKGPKEVSVYRNAYDFYRYALKDDDRARRMLQDGIAQTGSPDLQYLLDHYDDL